MSVALKTEEGDRDVAMRDDGDGGRLKMKRSPSTPVPHTTKDDINEKDVKPLTPNTKAFGAMALAKADSRDGKKTPPSRSSTTPAPAPMTPNGKASPTKPINGGGGGPQLIGDLPCAEESAMRTFEELGENHYQYSTLGRSREALESMTCDCSFVPGRDDPEMACGQGSDCINRLTQVECLEEDCRCRGYCKNQRMQRKEYANIEIVLTEKKGYGLRAGSDIAKDAFIYEYIGDVVSQPSFAKRMRDYAEQGIRHFYFMMLQKEQFIDATKRGGIGRFANHSCNPNCYVAKWTVGNHVRMGIYAKRNVRKDEELTFNYNVDRYGHDAQPCYCGEPNCVGVLGGKTQTDVGAMDDLYLDALGISEEVEMYGLKGSKKKKGKKLDEDYVPILKPLVEKDIPKVVQAIRQTQSRKVLLKLLSRIKMTDDQSALRQLMRLRGYSLMCNILEDYISDVDICSLIVESLETWPLLQRNKVEDSKIEEPLGILTGHENEKLRTLAKKLIEHWATLETGYRIPKRLKGEGDETSTPATPEVITFEEEPLRKRIRKGNVSELQEVDLSHIAHLKPLGRNYVPKPKPPPPPKRAERTASQMEIWRARVAAERAAGGKTPTSNPESVEQKMTPTPMVKKVQYVYIPAEPSYPNTVEGILVAAQRRAEEARKREEERLAAEKAEKERKEKELEKRTKRKEKAKQQHMTPEEKEALKEKRLQKLVGQVVVKCLSKHRHQMDRETFKKKAKELTCIIAEKEKKSNSYQSGKLDALSEEKISKIKKFSKEYIAKLLRRLEKKNAEGGGASGSGSLSVGKEDHEQEPLMSVEDALDLGADDIDENENDADEDEDENSGDPSPASDMNSHGPGPAVAVVGRDMDLDVDSADADGDIQMGNASFAGLASKRSRWDQAPSAIPADL